jgi:hypothetical protein
VETSPSDTVTGPFEWRSWEARLLLIYLSESGANTGSRRANLLRSCRSYAAQHEFHAARMLRDKSLKA